MAKSVRADTWELISDSPARRERLFGQKLLRSYAQGQFQSDPALAWLRDAVTDVRRSMNLGDAVFDVREVRVYHGLRLERSPPASPLVGALFATVQTTWTKKRGMVVLNPAFERARLLCITEEGLATPLVVYEEVAHCFRRKVPYAGSGATPAEQAERFHSEARKQAGRRTLQVTRQAEATRHLWWPIRCHREIYAGFLNNSQAYARSSATDRTFAMNQLVGLNAPQVCRVLHPNPGRCPC